MFLEIGIIVCGIPFGIMLKKSLKVKHIVSKASQYTVYALLFFLGLRIGSDEAIISQISIIGVKGLVMGIAVVVGSLLAGIWVHSHLKGLK